MDEIHEYYSQELLISDLSELKTRFHRKRENAEKLSQSFYRIGLDKRAQYTKDCGTQLAFGHDRDITDTFTTKGRLRHANFCRDKLCPMCNWRRSVKCFHQLSQVLDQIQDKYAFIFLTLTVVNPSGFDLRKTIDQMAKGWKAFHDRKIFQDVVKGFSRTLEITYNKKSDTYHPHYHVLIAVNKSYGKKGKYIKHGEWLQMWRDCFGDQNIEFVNVQFVKDKFDKDKAVREFEIEQRKSISETANYGSNITGALLEVTKYSIKDTDYLHNSIELTDKVISTLCAQISGVKMISFGGIIRKIRHDLNQDDPEDGDLTIVDGEKLNPMMQRLIMRYEWQIGAYVLVDSFVENIE